MKAQRSGFTLIELLVVIAIIAILAAILFPIFSKAKEKGKQTSCINNLMQLDKAMKMYGGDNEGKYPYAYEWATSDPNKKTVPMALKKYVPGTRVFACPSDWGDVAWAANTKLSDGTLNLPYWKKYGISYGYPGLPVYLPDGQSPYTPTVKINAPYLAGLPMDNPVPNGVTDETKFEASHLWIWRLPLSKRPELFDHSPWHYFTGCDNHDRLTSKGFNNLVFCDGHVHPMQFQTYLVLLGLKDGTRPF